LILVGAEALGRGGRRAGGSAGALDRRGRSADRACRAAVHEAIEALARHELAAAQRARGGRAARRGGAPT
jgi:hypothetical protein